MKKFLRVFLLATLMVSMIAACGNKVEQAKKETKKEISFNQAVAKLKTQSSHMDQIEEINVTPDDKSMTIKRYYFGYIDDENPIYELNSILGFGSGLNTKMKMTKIADGKQSFTSNGISVTWWITEALIGKYYHYLYEITE